MTFATTSLDDNWDILSQRKKEQESLTSECENKRLQQAQNLDRNALTTIYDEYQPLVYGYIFRRTGDVEIARDLTAEIFRRFLQAMNQGNGPSVSLRAWFYRVAHNIVVDHYRRQEFRQHIVLNDEICESGDSPDKAVEKRLLAEQVRTAITRLTVDQQQVITLKFLEGLSNQEVAQTIGKSVGAVKALQHRALATLQQQLTLEKEEVSV